MEEMVNCTFSPKINRRDNITKRRQSECKEDSANLSQLRGYYGNPLTINSNIKEYNAMKRQKIEERRKELDKQKMRE